MGIQVHIDQWPVSVWRRSENALAAGCAVLRSNGRRLDAGDLARLFDRERENPEAQMADLEGSWAAVIPSHDGLFAATDPMRAYPLFYGRRGTEVFLSDDGYWVADRLASADVDPLDAALFLLQGLVPGRRTLVDGVHQIQAGEAIRFSGTHVQATRYARYPVGTPVLGSGDLEEWTKAGESVLAGVGERLCARLAGRTPVVPLSGGLDSRLVAFLLAEAGRTDTVCFSYGRRRSAETRASREAARALGLSWHFVPYSNRAWSETYRSRSYQAYRRFAARLGSIEHEQDWPAVEALKTRGVLPENAVFVPGHSGDFLAGSHLPDQAFADGGPEDAVDWILSRYVNLWPRGALSDASLSALRARLASVLDDKVAPRSALSRFEQYGWQERQAKLIVNSVRVYEFHGYAWDLPLWDRELQAFWSGAPLALRRQKRLYRALLERLSGVFALPVARSRPPGFGERLARVLDLDYRRYGMFLGPHPEATGLVRRIEDLAGDLRLPLLQEVIRPVRRHAPQTRPLNALIALMQLRDVLERYG